MKKRSKDMRDYYYWEAKKKGYRSRAAFKLLQINRTFKVIKEGSTVLDLGSSPGGWSQVASQIASKVVAVDINPMQPIEGVVFIRGDITSPETLEKIKSESEFYDAVISDASPKITGKWSIDHFNSIELARASFEIAKEVLKQNGSFVVKIFQGEETRNFYDELKPFFRFKKFHSPKASRKRSAEIYFIGKGFRRDLL